MRSGPTVTIFSMTEPLGIELPAPALRIAEALTRHGHDAVLVGGALRDALLGKRAGDIDLVTDADPEQVRAALAQTGEVGSIYRLGGRFNTIGVALEGGGRVEITRYRELALGADTLPERVAADLAYRDFTVNAIAYDLAERRVLDPLSGREDLEARLLRAPGSADERLAEDPLRVVRAARLASELGFSIEATTAAALPRHAPALTSVAVERVRDELDRLLVAVDAPRGLKILRDTKALEAMLPEVAALDGLTQPSFHDLDVLSHTIQAVGLAPLTRVLRWATLMHDVGKAATRTVEADGRIRFLGHASVGAQIAEQICERLRMPHADTSAIVHLIAVHMRLGELDLGNPRAVDRAVRRLDLTVPASAPVKTLVTAEDVVELTLADLGATAHRDEVARVRAALHAAIAASRERGTHQATRSPVSGEKLMAALGIKAGPVVGKLKRAIEQAIEDGDLAADDVEGALRLASEVLASASAE